MNSGQVAYRLHSELDLHLALSQLPRTDWLADVDEARRNQLCTIAAELGSNMLKFADGGDLSICRRGSIREDLVEILAVDLGPGIADVEAAVREHFSSVGTLGLGLSGVVRMADQVHIESGPGSGTSVKARSWMSGRPVSERRRLTHCRREGRELLPLSMQWGAEICPHPGHRTCGDAVVLVLLPSAELLVVILDASGHGPRAGELATHLQAVATAHATADVGALLRLLHDASRGSGGAAAGVACADPTSRLLRYAGVGNVRARLVGPGNGQPPWSGVSKDGLLGDRFPEPFVQHVRLVEGQVLLLYSDGISESLCGFRGGLPGSSPAPALAWQIVRQCGRPTDDAACAVVRFG